MKQTKRIGFIDSVKGFAIFCVIWGHVIQYLRATDDPTTINNPIFEFIYSFHMPLFFMMSGFFFSSSLKLHVKDFLYKKALQLLLPCFTWAVLLTFFMTIYILFKKGSEYDLLIPVKEILIPTNWPFWFLKELFLSYVIVYLSLRVFKKDYLAFIISISIILITPFCAFQRFLLPVFWAGIYLKKNYQSIIKYSKPIFIISTSLFIVALFFWKGDYVIYMTKFPAIFNFRTLSFDLSDINIAIFRLLIGLTGSIFWIFLFQQFYSRNKSFPILEKIGTYTLGIYILQYTLLEKILRRIINLSSINIWIFNLIIAPVISVTIIIICIYLIRILSKNKYARLFLLGDSFEKLSQKTKNNH